MKRTQGIKNLVRYLPEFIQFPLIRSMIKVYAPPQGFVFKLAESPEEIEAAFRLLYECYLRENFCTSNDDRIRVTKYHLLPSTSHLIIKTEQGEVVGTMSIIGDGSFGLPADQVMPLDHLRKNGNRIAEISSLAIKPGYRGRLAMPFLKYFYQYVTRYEKLDSIVATTVSEVANFYEAVLLFKKGSKLAIPNYRFANSVTVFPLVLDLNGAPAAYANTYGSCDDDHSLFKFFVDGNSYDGAFQFPNKKYFTFNDHFMNPEILLKLLGSGAELSKSLSIEEREIILEQNLMGRSEKDLGQSVSSSRPSNLVQFRKRSSMQRFEFNCSGVLSRGLHFSPIKAMNLSESGVKLKTLGNDEIGLKGKIEFYLKAGPGLTIWAEGHVTWQNGDTIGVQIDSADNDWQTMVNDLGKIQSKVSHHSARRSVKVSA